MLFMATEHLVHALFELTQIHLQVLFSFDLPLLFRLESAILNLSSRFYNSL